MKKVYDIAEEDCSKWQSIFQESCIQFRIQTTRKHLKKQFSLEFHELEHQFENQKDTELPSCILIQKCKKCGYQKIENNHKFSEPKLGKNDCFQYQICDLCGTSLRSQNEEHNFGDWKYIEKDSCEQISECTNCKKIKETRIFHEKVTSYQINDSTIIDTCLRCGDKIKRIKIKCDECGGSGIEVETISHETTKDCPSCMSTWWAHQRGEATSDTDPNCDQCGGSGSISEVTYEKKTYSCGACTDGYVFREVELTDSDIKAELALKSRDAVDNFLKKLTSSEKKELDKFPSLNFTENEHDIEKQFLFIENLLNNSVFSNAAKEKLFGELNTIFKSSNYSLELVQENSNYHFTKV